MTITIIDYLQCLTYFMMFAIVDYIFTVMYLEHRLGIVDNIYLFIVLIAVSAFFTFLLSYVLWMDIATYAEEDDSTGD